MRMLKEQHKKNYCLLLVFTILYLVLSSFMQGFIILVIGLLFWTRLYRINIKNNCIEFVVVKLLIFSIPFSFHNVLGGSYGDIPISWFNILIFLLIVIFLFKSILRKKIYFNLLSLGAILILGLSIIPVIVSSFDTSAFNQYINFSMAFVLIPIGTNIKVNFTEKNKTQLLEAYIKATKVTSFGILTQVFSYAVLNYQIGKYAFLGSYRHAFGFLFSDYSFLSLYLSSGAIACFLYRKDSNGSKILWLSNVAIMLIASILTSARTGIAAFIVVFSIYTLKKFFVLIYKGSINAFFIMILNVVIVSISVTLVSKIRGTARLSDSGRGNLNKIAYEVFLKNPWVGVGFGNSGYIGMLPHNLFFQSLAQGGLVFTLPLISCIIFVLWIAYKKDKIIFPILMCVFIGSLFIPNIFNSRFLPVLFLIFSIRLTHARDGKTCKLD